MKLNTDTKERIKIGGLFIFQSYKIIMGSLLTLFVPQICEFPEEENRVCTIMDNINKDQLINNISLGFNCASVILFLACYYIELRRENFLIKHLDINHQFADHNLDKIITEKPKFKTDLLIHNTFYFKFILLTSLLYSINLILSSIAIYEHYAGISTITAYTSYIALILLKLYNSLYISYHSKTKNRALSAYMTEFSSFNVFDKDYLDGFENSESENIDNIQTNVNIQIINAEKKLKPKALSLTEETVEEVSEEEVSEEEVSEEVSEEEVSEGVEDVVEGVEEVAEEEVKEAISEGVEEVVEEVVEEIVEEADTQSEDESIFCTESEKKSLYNDLNDVKIELK